MTAPVAAPVDLATPSVGLSTEEAARRRRRDGPNTLPQPPPPSRLGLLVGQMTHFFALMLWVAALLALVAGMPQLAVAIAVVVVLNAVFAFAQEYRADRAGRRLRDLLPVEVTVVRDGHARRIPAGELVVGDLVLLQAGDRVCADLVLREVHAFAVDESLLTGESRSVRPEVGGAGWAGTFVVEGEGTGVVRAIGGCTRLAEIAELSAGARPPSSPLARQLHKVVRTVALVAIGVGASFFAIAVAFGTPPSDGLLFAVGVTVALVPEGLLPTVTLSLARASQRMAHEHALVRHLEAVETLGSTTFICTDKTGTITANKMAVVEVWTPTGSTTVAGTGYQPTGTLTGPVAPVRDLAVSALLCSRGRALLQSDEWVATGDPMEVALHVLAMRAGLDTAAVERDNAVDIRYPFDPRRRRASVVSHGVLHVKGAPDTVLPLCRDPAGAAHAVDRLSALGLRVLAVARRNLGGTPPEGVEQAETDLELLGLVGLEDPPRSGVRDAVRACRSAGIRIALVTGDHPGTARTVAVEVGIIDADGPVLEGQDLPADQAELARLIDRDVVLARVTPEDKLRIARALQSIGHVVTMTGDGVNDGPALRAADVGVAMGASGTDVARESADLVLLDDRFESIVAAVRLGRATFSNIKRFLTYHLTDNVAELTPFVLWALSGGQIPLALTVLQVLALDIGTDLLPALALGGEPASEHAMNGPARTTSLIDGGVLRRVFGVLGPAEALVEMTAFTAVLLAGGWTWGQHPTSGLLMTASGAAFAAVVLGQLANAFACRSESSWVGAKRVTGNPMLVVAVLVELALLLLFLGIPALADLLGGGWPSPLGWAVASTAIVAVVLADAAHKAWRARA
jgi:calcium-translocating P-type ATPase